MDTLANLKAFLSVARTGSFAGAARELGVAPSVVTKRISQIEWRLQSPLFERTTRRVSLTAMGQHYLPGVQRVVADLDGLFADVRESAQNLQGHVRVKVPGSLAAVLLGGMLNGFQAQYPLISLEVMALERAVNPADEGFDLALTLLPHAFPGVVEETLCRMPRMICASPAYVERKGMPSHPRELPQHDILNFTPTGNVWEFGSDAGTLRIDVRPRLNTNEAQFLLSSAIAGNGIALLSGYLAAPALRSGALVQVLPEFPMTDMWMKALLPENRAQIARVQALVRWLKERLAAQEPWTA